MKTVFCQSLRYAQKIILGGKRACETLISTICLLLFFLHALILNKNPHLWMDTRKAAGQRILRKKIIFPVKFISAFTRAKKIPGLKLINPRMSLFHPQRSTVIQSTFCPRRYNLIIQAGLLTYGSSYQPHLPIYLQANSGTLRLSSPITAAGPSQIYTGFPFKLLKST